MKDLLDKYFWKQPLRYPQYTDVGTLYKMQNDEIFRKEIKGKVIPGVIKNKDDFTEINIITTLISHSSLFREICKAVDYDIKMADKDDMNVPDIIVGDWSFDITAFDMDLYRFKNGVEYEESKVTEMSGGKIVRDDNGKIMVFSEKGLDIKVDSIMKSIRKKSMKKYIMTDVGVILWPGKLMNTTINPAILIFQKLILNNYEELKKLLEKIPFIFIFETNTINSIPNDIETGVQMEGSEYILAPENQYNVLFQFNDNNIDDLKAAFETKEYDKVYEYITRWHTRDHEEF